MNNESYSEWQKAWIHKGEADCAPEIDTVMNQLQRHEKQTLRINRIKGGSIAFLSVIIIGQVVLSRRISWDLPSFALLLVLLNTFLFTGTLLSRQFRTTKLDLGQPALGFIRQAIDSLQAERRHIRRYIFPFLFLQIMGINIWYSHLWPASTLPRLLALHLGSTLFLIAAAAIGLRLRHRRYARTSEPLIARLRETEKAWSRGETQFSPPVD